MLAVTFSRPPQPGEMQPFYLLVGFLGQFLLVAVYWKLYLELSGQEHANLAELSDQSKLLHINILMFLQFLLLLGAILFGFHTKDLLPEKCGFKKLPLKKIASLAGQTVLVSLLPVGLVILLTSSLRNEENMHEMFKIMQNSHDPMVFLLILLSAVILAPLWEELLYRVCLQGVLQKLHPVGGILVTAVIFSMAHGWPDSLALIPLSLMLGVLYYWKRSYLTNVLAHALFNSYNFLLALMTLSSNS